MKNCRNLEEAFINKTVDKIYQKQFFFLEIRQCMSYSYVFTLIDLEEKGTGREWRGTGDAG